MISLSGTRTNFDFFVQSISIHLDDALTEYTEATTDHGRELATVKVELLDKVVEDLAYYLGNSW